MPQELNLDSLFALARSFARKNNAVNHRTLVGVTDGKAVGTYVEHLFEDEVRSAFPDVEIGNSARGMDIPDPRVRTDIKVTSIHKPQSSCPFQDARQKIYGLGNSVPGVENYDQP